MAVWPTVEIGERLDGLGLFGAVLVVAGSGMTALGKSAESAEPVALE